MKSFFQCTLTLALLAALYVTFGHSVAPILTMIAAEVATLALMLLIFMVKADGDVFRVEGIMRDARAELRLRVIRHAIWVWMIWVFSEKSYAVTATVTAGIAAIVMTALNASERRKAELDKAAA